MKSSPRLASYVPGLLWGCWLLVLAGLGTQHVPAVPSGFHITVITCLGGLLPLGIYALLRRRQLAWTRLGVRSYGLIGLMELAQNGTYLAGAYLVVKSSPLLIPLTRVHTTYLILLVGWVLEKLNLAQAEPVTRRKLLAVIATVTGLVILAFEKVKGGTVAGEPLGFTLLAASTILSAFQHFVQARVSSKAGSASIVPGTIVQVAVVALAGSAVLAGTGQLGHLDYRSVLYLLGAGVFLCGIAFLARFASYVVAGLTAFEMAVRQELEYVVQAITAVLFLGAALTGWTIFGAALVLGAALLVQDPQPDSALGI